MKKPRGISSGEAMRWNEDVERRRKAYHEMRCAEHPIYKRAYERLQDDRRRMQELIGKSIAQLSDAMNADYQQRINCAMEDAEQQPVREHKEAKRDRALLNSTSKHSAEGRPHDIRAGLGIAFAATMLIDSEKICQRLIELEEERPYLEEIRKADQEFDRELIRMSGFEW